MTPKVLLPFLAFVMICAMSLRAGRAAEPSFSHDVMAVLSKAGCNSGPCHGNQNGKGGLKLSLRGEDRRFDYLALARQNDGRRIDTVSPEKSLILLKATSRISHQGGMRFKDDSLEYKILLDWITNGANERSTSISKLLKIDVQPRQGVLPESKSTVQLKVVAHFEDGSQRDVTRLATYETSNLSVSVRPEGIVERQAFGEATVLVRFLSKQEPVRLAFLRDQPNFAWQSPPMLGYIDRHLFAKLKTLQINPSATVDDSLFVRRAYLDALGILPTATEARTFVSDRSRNKRSRLIDALLVRPEFADHWALKWCDLLRVEEKVLDAKGVAIFHRWIRDGIAEGKPVNEFVHELIAARGSTYENPPANFYRANRDAVTRGETAARLFLGVRLQCAQCHNHPFDQWTQDDYYSWAALFSRIDYKIVNNNRKDKFDKHEFDGEQIVEVKDSGEVTNARTKKNAEPKFLGGNKISASEKVDRLTPLADWLTSKDNTRFAESQANFVWYHLMGKGLVEPMDDFRATNPPVNPPLLKALTEDFIQHHFDLRHLVRSIMTSQAYQLSAEPNDTNREDDSNFSHAIIRRLPAEKLLDAQTQVLGSPPKFTGYERGIRAGQIPGVRKVRDREQPPSAGDRFLAAFGKPPRLMACDCERSNETTLAQAFSLISGDDLNHRIVDSENRLHRLAASKSTHEQLVQELYWAALTRPPSTAELHAAVTQMNAEPDRLFVLQDLAWALLNAKEFVFRR